MTQPRILIVEDDPESGAAIFDTLAGAHTRPLLASDLGAALAAAKAEPFDALVLDRMLPDGDGLDFMRAFQAARPGVPVLVLSALGTTSMRVEGLEQGADDYLAKPFEGSELVARVRALLRRGKAALDAGDLMQFHDLQIRPKARTVHAGQTYVPLSPREFDLLLFFARNHGDVVTRMQLLQSVWNLHFDPETNVVDVHVGRLRRKLEAGLGRRALHTVRGQGYRFDVTALRAVQTDVTSKLD